MIKITSDSTCDLSQELYDKHQITIHPLCVVKDGESFRDGVEIKPEEIYQYVDATGNLCTTVAVNVAEYYQFFKPFSEEYDAVIHINLGSGFSSCHQNARLAAQEFSNVYVIDSANLSSGQGLLVLEAAAKAEAGWSAEEICAYLEDLKPRIETSFLLERLDYMQKGGRCTSVVAFGANLLKLRVSIEVKDGKMQVAKKYRGAYDHCIAKYVEDRLKDRTDLELDHIMITDTCYTQQVTGTAHAAVDKFQQFENVFETKAGCTVACHCGPNCLGVLFIRK